MSKLTSRLALLCGIFCVFFFVGISPSRRVSANVAPAISAGNVTNTCNINYGTVSITATGFDLPLDREIGGGHRARVVHYSTDGLTVSLDGNVIASPPIVVQNLGPILVNLKTAIDNAMAAPGIQAALCAPVAP